MRAIPKKNLNRMLLALSYVGCHPCISRRGKVWRAHINAAGNQWSEAGTPEDALRVAIECWERRERPMDGYAALVATEAQCGPRD